MLSSDQLIRSSTSTVRPALGSWVSRLGGRALPIVAVLAAAGGMGSDHLYRSNQNTYLAHAVGPSLPQLRGDWFLTTSDPVPLFTAVSRALYQSLGRTGLYLFGFALAVAAFAGLALIAASLVRESTPTVRQGVPPLAVMIVSAASYLLPRTHIAGISWIHPFAGFGGQYLLSVPLYVQSSDCGALLLLGIGLAVRGVHLSNRGRWRSAASLLAVVTCALHPTYLAPLAITLGSFAVADLVARCGNRRFWWYAPTGVAAIAVVLATNPVVRQSLSYAHTDVQRRLAFERIAHHTLATHWDPRDAVFAVTALLGAAGAAHFARNRWPATAIVVAITLAIATAAFVTVTRSLTVAMMFPWRVTVLLTPIGSLVLAVLVLRMVLPRLPGWSITTITVAASMVCLAVGAHLTLTTPPPAKDPAVQLVRVAAPSGVGLIPPELANIRLNAPASIYVDVKSNPYAEVDLTEWYRRLDRVRTADTDDASFCSLVRDEDISWALLRPGRSVPMCLTTWRAVIGSAGEVRVR